MSKVSGSYESVVRGVSEQNAQSRRSGQHEAQVNMISDPVRGLARRHGSIMQDEKVIAAEGFDEFVGLTAKTRVSPFFVGGREYDAIFRPSPATGSPAARASLIQCFDKEARKFVPVALDNSPLVDQLVTGGISAIANVGRFLYVAGKTVVPTVQQTARWDNFLNQRMLAVWIRGGAYSREFSIKLVRANGTTIVGKYKTKASSYPELLDTSDIVIGTGDNAMNDYTKAINDRTNLFNSKSTAWIGEAAADITPQNIAAKLVAALVQAGASSVDVAQRDGYVVVNGDYVEIEANDGGDDSLVRSVGNTIKNLDMVSSRHFAGKVVKVEPEKNAGDPFYLLAVAKDAVSTGWTEVVWRETAGFEMRPTSVFAFGTVHNGTFYLAGSAAGLQALSGIDVPNYEPNKVGDAGSAPLPNFFGKRIDYMGVFQDRLIIGAGATLMFSRSGDYLNWFRKSVATINDDDPWEGYALGSEDDTIVHGAIYDKGLLLYGERYQYSITGRQAFTPQSANISIASSYKEAVEAAPKASGNYVFYAKYSGAVGKEITSLHQVQPGAVSDVSDSYPASQQLDTYLSGIPVELLTLEAPNIVLLRTTTSRTRVFTYSYMDNPNSTERLFDSWSCWTWNEGVGYIVGMSDHKSDILVYMLRKSVGADGKATVWYAAEKFVRDADLSDYPYLDSLRPLSAFLNNSGALKTTLSDNAPLAFGFGRGGARSFLGSSLANIGQFLSWYPEANSESWVGYQYPSYVTPTNPFIRDRNGQAVLGGRLTLGRVKVAVTNTGGMTCEVTARGHTRQSLNFTGRVLGANENLVGRQPITDANLSAVIGGEVRECSYTLAAVKWLPLTINAIEWQGQSFMNTRRV